MKVIVRNPPLFALLAAIALNLPVRRLRPPPAFAPPGWLSRRLERFLERRESRYRRA